MINNLPLFISIVFGLTTIATLIIFYLTIKKSNLSKQNSTFVLLGMMFWLIIQAVLTLKNVYKSDLNSMPPKIMLFGILPVITSMLFLFFSQKGKQFIDSLPLKNLTFIHIVRIPVEIVLFWLFINKAIPELMTFEGRNFDILAGISAPFITFLGFIKDKISRKFILIWNIFCLGLLINIIVNAILSAPSPLQQFGFDQPNIAILNFPFSWLPTFIVPVVFFSHLTSIRQLLKKN